MLAVPSWISTLYPTFFVSQSKRPSLTVDSLTKGRFLVSSNSGTYRLDELERVGHVGLRLHTSSPLASMNMARKCTWNSLKLQEIVSNVVLVCRRGRFGGMIMALRMGGPAHMLTKTRSRYLPHLMSSL